MKTKDITWIVLGFAIISLCIYKIGRRIVAEHLLIKNSQHIKAVIIDERNYMGNEPVRPNFSYSYQFDINGKKYSGNSHDTTL